MEYYPLDLARVLNVHSAPIVLRLVDGPEAAGHFGAAVAIVVLLFIPTRAIMVVLQPRFSLRLRGFR